MKMIPRIEEKVELNPSQYINILSWLRARNFQVLHPERTVNSIYFDNHSMQMRHDTQEGVTPRRKLRIRYYGDQDIFHAEKLSLETKLTTPSGRFKSVQTFPNSPESFRNGLVDKVYGLCFPVVRISYTREYYNLGNWRVTIDRNISYARLSHSAEYRRDAVDTSYVLEVKASAGEDRDALRNFFCFARSKFSKYERSFQCLYG